MRVEAIDVEQLFRPKSVGEPVNMHVVERVREPAPDFEAMRRIIEGRDREPKDRVHDEPERREVPSDS